MGERANDTGYCFPTQAELSRKTCIPLRTLKRKMQVLVDSGVMLKTTKQVEQNLRRNSYVLQIDREHDLLEPAKNSPIKNSAKLAPSKKQPEKDNSAKLAPSIVPERHHSDEQWCHPDGTNNSATHVAHRPSLDGQSNSNSTTATTGEHPIFTQAERPTTRDRVTMVPNWKPSDHVFTMLAQRAITEEFARDQLDGFVLFHNGKSDRQGAFDSKFLKHVIHNWESAKTAARPMPADWKPDMDTINRLAFLGIHGDFIRERQHEFVTYWQESGQSKIGWNAKFYDSVTTAWNKKVHADQQTPGGQAVSQTASQIEAGRKADQLIGKLTDRSWAEG
jgi:hypothetical protein